jgi:uncharacterized UPF0160 family protein
MSILVATHSGPFHADDVLSWALIRTFMDDEARLVRSRDPETLAKADVVVDVGGTYDVTTQRFDHHQTSYTGQFSSAGMVLEWLTGQCNISPDLSAYLKRVLVDYVDDVDNGRVMPNPEVPCFASMVEAYAQSHSTLEEFTGAFLQAGEMATRYVDGLKRGFEEQTRSVTAIRQAMKDAEDAGRAVLFFDSYYKWKPGYFASGGCEHSSNYVLLPGVDSSWRILAIPPEEGSFAQKRPLPESWAGLTGETLEDEVGVAGAVFCHKNRFIAVFTSRDAALEALEKHGLLWL